MKSNKISSIKNNLLPLPVIILILIFILIGISRYIFFNIEKDIHNSQLKELEEVTIATNWSLIEGTIREASLAAQSSSYFVSNNIVEEIHKEYPDLELLKQDLDSNKFNETKLPKIILKNIENRYLFNIRNKHNDIFVIMNNGIAVDRNLDSLDTVYRSFEDEATTHFNYELAYQAFERLLEHKNHNIIYYEPEAPDNKENHNTIVSPSYDALYDIYCKEGIKGLKGYTVLVPTYITDNGDIFGTPDISIYGKRVQNHKMIVVQRFNIYDILMFIHEKDLKVNEATFQSMRNKLIDSKQVRTITYVSIMILDLIGLLVLIFYTSIILKINKQKIDRN